MRARRRLHGESGSADALGMALIAPVMLALALVVLLLGRAVDGRATTHGAAESAAQAAARQRTPAAAIAAAHDVGSAMLAGNTSCASPKLSVDVSGFRPGGIVGVTVSCSVNDAGLELVAPRRTARSTATAYAIIDRFRAAEGTP